MPKDICKREPKGYCNNLKNVVSQKKIENLKEIVIMSRWSNLLLNVNYMKKYAADVAKKVTIDISRDKMTDMQNMCEAMMARFQLDKLLLGEMELYDKWAQSAIHDYESESIVFRGTHEECVEYINKNDVNGTMEIYYILPDEKWFDYKKYIRDTCYDVVFML